MTRTDRQDRETHRTLLLCLVAFGLVVAYYVVPVLIWGAER